jgi:uncharacterized protein (TIGR02271 family)
VKQPAIHFCLSAAGHRHLQGGLDLTEHIVALFKTEATAAAAERDLEAAGIPTSVIRRYAPTQTETFEPGSTVAGATETTHSTGGGFWAWLWGEDSNTTSTRSAYPTDGDIYDRQTRAGNTVLSVMLHDDSLIHQTVTILDAHHPIEIDEHTQETEPASFGKTSAPPSGLDYSTSAVATPATGMAAPSSAALVTQESDTLPAGLPSAGRVAPVDTSATGDEVIPLAEELLEIGKRTVDRGTTRVRRYVVEKPVEQDVTLHGERVTIERRRPIDAAAASVGAFEERTVEVRETEEVPVVGKTARVVEEVAIRKEATARTETVRDTVRREEVEVTGNGIPTQPPRP